MNLIELHILQSFPVTCLNRDDLGSPKTAVFGGSTRARVSSQSWKRAIRTLAKEESADLFGGNRSRYVVRELIQQFSTAACEEELAVVLGETCADAIGTLDDKNPQKVKTLLYFSPNEFSSVVGEVLEHGGKSIAADVLKGDAKSKKKSRAELQKICKKATKSLAKQVKDAADIAFFGRMVADDASLTVEASGLFSHALSTHSQSNDLDFFSAVDDLKVGEEDAGAGHIGTIEFNSACYYRYVGLNLDMLFDDDHLGHFSDEERRGVLHTFLQAAILAIPEARKNSMFGMNPPQHVLGVCRRGQPISLINAFERPVPATGSGYVEPSINALKDHWERMKTSYDLEGAIAAECELPSLSLKSFIEGLLAGGMQCPST